MGLGFLSPLFLAGLAAAAIPILVHLFRRQADPVVPFGAVRLLQRAPVEQAQRKRLREWILLALRTTALVLLALSFARPYFAAPAAAVSGPLSIVAVDTSYSVSAPGQMERARELARQAIDAAPTGAVALVRFDATAETVVPPTMDRSAARSAVATLAPGEASTSYARLIARAMDVADHRPSELVVVTDLQQAGWSVGDEVPPVSNMRVSVRTVPPPHGNLSLADLGATASHAVVQIRNAYPDERETVVRISADDRAIDERRVKVPGGETTTVTFDRKLPASGALRATLTDPDGYQADNQRYVVLDPTARTRIVAITGPGNDRRDAIYFQRAVAAVEGDAGIEVTGVTADRLGGDAAVLRDAAAVILVGTAGLDRRGLDALAAMLDNGRSLLVAAGPSVELDRVIPALAPGLRVQRVEDVDPPATVAPVDVRHPAFAAFGVDGGLLGSAAFRRFVRLEGTEARVLARFSNGAPALLEIPRARGRVLVLASDVANHWNDLVLHPAFVPLAHDLARYLAGAAAPQRAVLVGELPGPEGARVGVITRVATADGPALRVAVNVDPRESDPARMSAEAFEAVIPKVTAQAQAESRAADARRQESEQSLWRYGLALMLIGLVIESAVGRRG